LRSLALAKAVSSRARREKQSRTLAPKSAAPVVSEQNDDDDDDDDDGDDDECGTLTSLCYFALNTLMDESFMHITEIQVSLTHLLGVLSRALCADKPRRLRRRVLVSRDGTDSVPGCEEHQQCQSHGPAAVGSSFKKKKNIRAAVHEASNRGHQVTIPD
jgi:hypothetical protein